MGDIGVRVSSGTGPSKSGEVTAEESKREYGVVQSKIEAVKKAIEQKKKGI